MWVLLAGGLLLEGCSPAAVDISLRVIQGLSTGLNSSGLFDTLVQSVLVGA